MVKQKKTRNQLQAAPAGVHVHRLQCQKTLSWRKPKEEQFHVLQSCKEYSQ